MGIDTESYRRRIGAFDACKQRRRSVRRCPPYNPESSCGYTCYDSQRYSSHCGFLGHSRCHHYRSIARTCYRNCPVNGGWSVWSAWQETVPCSVSCSTGRHTLQRQRACNHPAPAFGGSNCAGQATETRVDVCNDFPCPVDGAWTLWTEWVPESSCSQTCGDGGLLTLARRRACANPFPTFGGRFCPGDAAEYRSEACSLAPCPVASEWADWSPWLNNQCSVTCGGGMSRRRRNRQCKPIGQSLGPVLDCAGPDEEVKTSLCNPQSCPGDGGWGRWSHWAVDSACSVTCGQGQMTRSRQRACDSPVPTGQGKACEGNALELETTICNLQNCDASPHWSDWSAWRTAGQCPVTCGQSVQQLERSRFCIQGIQGSQDSQGSGQCRGDSVDTGHTACFAAACQVDGHWGPWGNWSMAGECSALCDGGTVSMRRERQCQVPPPNTGSATCSGAREETRPGQACNTQKCQNLCWSPIPQAYPHPRDSGLYFRCLHGKPLLQRCPQGTAFDVTHEACLRPQ